MEELRRTWLVQRLNKPYKNDSNLGKVAEHFAFGGGLKNGGLSEEAMSLLRPVFSFDYMGCAEFEFGEIPKCFQEIAKNIDKYSNHQIVINDMPVYILSPIKFKKEIEKRVKELAKCKCYLKEDSRFDVALGLNKWSKKEDCRHIGWLELNNQFVFFIDKETFQKTAEVFGIKTE